MGWKQEKNLYSCSLAIHWAGHIARVAMCQDVLVDPKIYLFYASKFASKSYFTALHKPEIENK